MSSPPASDLPYESATLSGDGYDRSDTTHSFVQETQPSEVTIKEAVLHRKESIHLANYNKVMKPLEASGTHKDDGEWTVDYASNAPLMHLNPHFCFHCNRMFERTTIVKAPSVQWRNDGILTLNPRNGHRENNSVFGHKDNYLAFVESAHEGCHLCAILLAQLSAVQRQDMQEHHKSKPKKGFICVSETLDQRVSRYKVTLGYRAPRPGAEHQTSANHGDWALMSTYLRPSHDPICNIQLDARRLGQDSTSKMICSWIGKCNEQHICMRNIKKEHSTRPTRLIFVGQEDDYLDVRLCSRHEIDDNAPYVTLSHCWGPKGLDYKLVKACEEDFQNNIPFKFLPQTFKDAISATRKLRSAFGVSYLWIDALCILQDSEDDWEHESSIMGDIYLNSYCNLAACLGNDSRAGLFEERNLFKVHHCKAKGGEQSCFEGDFEVGDFLAHETAVVSSVLLSRGWVFQELSLAPRILYFTPDQVFWECSEACFEENRPQEELKPNRHRFWIPPYRHMAFEQNSYTWTETQSYKVWSDAVESYSTCSLTKSKDKLIAIAGLAKLLKESFGEHTEYVAGLWTHCLFLHLLWRPCPSSYSFTGKSPRKMRPTEYRAPTWSWASIDNPVNNFLLQPIRKGLYSSLIDIVHVKVEKQSEDDFMRIRSASLVIKATLLKANLVVTDHEYTYRIERCGQKILNSTAFGLDAPLLQQGIVEVYCLPVAEIITKSQKDPDLYGLVLQRVGKQSRHFERIGLFQVIDTCEPTWQAFTMEQKRNPAVFATECDEVHGANIYTLTIL